MPSRKQRRKRQKERRHEYEFVYVDSEGQEVEADPDDVEVKPRRDERRNGKRDAQKGKVGGGRAPRKVDPPSWGKTARRAAIFAPLIFVAFSFLNGNQSIATRLALTLLYTAFFVPFMYLMDRTMYRTYLRRTGQSPPPSAGRRR